MGNGNPVGIVAAIALLAFPFVVAEHQGPPEGSVCTFGYDPDAFTNACITDGGGLPVPVTTEDTACLIGNFCAPVPRYDESPDPEQQPQYDRGVYVEVVCNQPVECGCLEVGNGTTACAIVVDDD